MNESIRIPLGKSGEPAGWAVVDLDDYERIAIYHWYLSGRGYAFRSSGRKSVFMHRQILNFPLEESINHRNGDQLDNRKENLEACSQLDNTRVNKRDVWRIQILENEGQWIKIPLLHLPNQRAGFEFSYRQGHLYGRYVGD